MFDKKYFENKVGIKFFNEHDPTSIIIVSQIVLN